MKKVFILIVLTLGLFCFTIKPSLSAPYIDSRAPILNTGGVEGSSNCVWAKVGSPNTAFPILPPSCSASGNGSVGTNGPIPTADRITLLNQVKQLVLDRRIKFTHDNDRIGLENGSGIVRRKDGAMITIDSQVLRLYVYFVQQGYNFTVCSMIGTHDKYSKSGNVSRHWEGHAFDVCIVNGKNVNSTSSTQQVVLMMKTMNNLIGGDLVPHQSLCAGAGRKDPQVDALSMNKSVIAPGFTGKYVGDHTDHIHIGY